ncbi:DUF624 domain-containing protein [Cellulomonas denverensis]|uniref:DUF624 domain-containing protein n=1 Tax=Cellulomonas denverensis TaxID=264297 RepID=A0A7X6R0I8_9CELL|nr:DUF624 domain-containing protein [Cellulomonas denverensis]NKY24250.1 DUF624 domain-containing protein [Cellulomonas denverensis]GIG26725.1 hypothetical protein Cde04nite_29690 [Cellulomonas denverensis]
MNARTWTDEEVGPGVLSRAAAGVYRCLVLELLLVLTTLPTAAALVVLERDPSNLPLYLLALLPAGPAVVAGLAAARSWEVDRDLSPARGFWRAYRRDALGTLSWWAPLLLVATVPALNIAYADAVPGGAALRPVSLVIAALLVVLAAHLAVIQARFTFRLRDAVRIALIEVLPQWRFSLGVLSLLLIGATITVLAFDVVAALLAWAAVLLLHAMARPLVTDITERFTRHD